MKNTLLKKRVRYFMTWFLALTIMAGNLGCAVVEEKSWIPDWTHIEKKNLPPFSHSRSAELDEGSIKKVLIVPFAFENGPEKVSETITQVFAVELGRARLFRLINPSVKPLDLMEAGKTLWDSGVVDVDTLLKARKKYGVEGFLFGKITNYKPYIPLIFGVKITMISALSGATLWSIDGDFDSDQKEIVSLAKDYYKKFYSKDQSLYGWELMLISMERYSRFVASMLVSTMLIED